MDINKFDRYLKDKEEKKSYVNEADLKYERSMQKRISAACDKGQDAFWNAVTKEFKEVEKSNIDSYTVQEFAMSCERAVKNWVARSMKKPNMPM